MLCNLALSAAMAAALSGSAGKSALKDPCTCGVSQFLSLQLCIDNLPSCWSSSLEYAEEARYLFAWAWAREADVHHSTLYWKAQTATEPLAA